MNKSTEFLRQRKTADAQRSLREAEHNCSSLPEFYATLALSYDLQDQHIKAQEAYRKAIAMNPHIAQFHDNLGISYASSGNSPASITQFERALQIDPHDVAANLNLASYYLRQHEYPRAIGHFQAAGIQHSSNIRALMGLTQAYLGTYNIAAARETATRLSRLAGSDSKVHFSLGLILAENRQYDLAAEEFEAIPATDRDFAAYMNLGMAYSKLRKFKKARDAYQSALELDPSSPDPYLHIGLDSAAMGEEAQAVNWIGQAHAETPEREDVAYAFAEALIDNASYDRAHLILSQALQAHPRSPALLEAQGDFYLHQDQPEKAKRAYLKCLEISPMAAGARVSLAKAYLELHQPETARQELENVLHAQPDNPDANARLGRMALDEGRQEDAQRMVSKALQADPVNRIANETLAEIRIREGRYSGAFRILQNLVKLDPNIPKYHYLLGRVLLKLGQAAKAQREFQRSQSLQNAPLAARPNFRK
ncbi:MAG: tetratricopeptide repeat protein [Acidobacteriota bacterium]|nr:tetratricopeptide repeat protein [Acidobacteriota bacterium]